MPSLFSSKDFERAVIAALLGKPLTSEKQEALAPFKKTGTSGGGQDQSFAESILAKKD